MRGYFLYIILHNIIVSIIILIKRAITKTIDNHVCMVFKRVVMFEGKTLNKKDKYNIVVPI